MCAILEESPKNWTWRSHDNFWASICWPSSHTRVTSVNSLSSRSFPKAELTFSLKLFHCRHSFSDIVLFGGVVAQPNRWINSDKWLRYSYLGLNWTNLSDNGIDEFDGMMEMLESMESNEWTDGNYEEMELMEPMYLMEWKQWNWWYLWNWQISFIFY